MKMVWLKIGVILGIISIVTADTEADSTLQSSACILPKDWRGEWFQKEYRSYTVIIDDHSISRGKDAVKNIGNCLKKLGGNYIFENKNAHDICTKCIFMESVHENVLHYKETDCAEDQTGYSIHEHDESLNFLCKDLGPMQQQFLFKADPKPIECPFREGPYNFSYSRGNSKICSYPASTVGSCMEKSQLVFRYQGCHDNGPTQGSVEEITCIGKWMDGNNNYLAAIVYIQNPGRSSSLIDESYRCFVYDKFSEDAKLGTAGMKVAISGSATCTDLHSPDVGDKVLSVYKDSEKTFCAFPKWFTSKSWHTLDHHLIFESHSPYKDILANLDKALDRPVTKRSRITCSSSANYGDTGFSVIARAVQGCEEAQTVCIKLIPQTDSISQVLIAELSMDEMDKLREKDFVSECLSPQNGSSTLNLTSVTLISNWKTTIECPYTGQFHIEGFNKAGKVIPKVCESTDPLLRHPSQLNIGCSSSQSNLKYTGGCENNDVNAELIETVSQCLGFWEDDDVEYLVTSFHSKDSNADPQIYCFQIYNNSDHLTVSALEETCPIGTRVHPSNKSLNFKLIPKGSCFTDSYDSDPDSESPENLHTLGSDAAHLRFQIFWMIICVFATTFGFPCFSA